MIKKPFSADEDPALRLKREFFMKMTAKKEGIKPTPESCYGMIAYMMEQKKEGRLEISIGELSKEVFRNFVYGGYEGWAKNCASQVIRKFALAEGLIKKGSKAERLSYTCVLTEKGEGLYNSAIKPALARAQYPALVDEVKEASLEQYPELSPGSSLPDLPSVPPLTKMPPPPDKWAGGKAKASAARSIQKDQRIDSGGEPDLSPKEDLSPEKIAAIEINIAEARKARGCKREEDRYASPKTRGR